MSRKISLGTKKKSFNSIMEAAKLQAATSGEPVQRVYIRLWKRINAGKKVASAIKAPARQYVRRSAVEQQVAV